jgi:hypothetical protein
MKTKKEQHHLGDRRRPSAFAAGQPPIENILSQSHTISLTTCSSGLAGRAVAAEAGEEAAGEHFQSG